MRTAWVVLVSVGCPADNHPDAREYGAVALVQAVMVPSTTYDAKKRVEIPISTTDGDQLFMILASTDDVNDALDINIGQNWMQPWLRPSVYGCATVQPLLGLNSDASSASSIVFTPSRQITMEIALLELTPSPHGGASEFQPMQIDGTVIAPRVDTVPGGLVVSMIAACSPVSLVTPQFRSLGFSTPGVDVAFELTTETGELAGAWSHAKLDDWAAVTFSVMP